MPLHGLCVLFVALVESEICIWGLARQRKGLSGTDTIEKGTYGGMFFSHIGRVWSRVEGLCPWYGAVSGD